MNEAPGEDLVRYTGADALSTREAVVNARAELARRQLQLVGAPANPFSVV